MDVQMTLKALFSEPKNELNSALQGNGCSREGHRSSRGGGQPFRPGGQPFHPGGNRSSREGNRFGRGGNRSGRGGNRSGRRRSSRTCCGDEPGPRGTMTAKRRLERSNGGRVPVVLTPVAWRRSREGCRAPAQLPRSMTTPAFERLVDLNEGPCALERHPGT